MTEKIEFVAIKLNELFPNQILGFDVFIYMHLNKKYVKYVGAKDVMDPDQLSKLEFMKVKELFIKKEDLGAYNKFISRSIRKKIEDSKDNEEAKVEIIKNEAKNIIENINSISTDKGAVDWTNNCIELSSAVVKEIGGKRIGNIYDKLKQFLSDKPTLVNHSLSTSSLSVISGMALGFSDSKTLTELSIGGLLHDIGLAELEEKLVEKYLKCEELTSAETELFQTHPHKGVGLLGKLLKVRLISDNVINIVLEHHENALGTGFPHGLPNVKKGYLSKIVSIADGLSLKIVVQNNTDLKYHLLRMQWTPEGDKHIYDNKILTQIISNLKYDEK